MTLPSSGRVSGGQASVDRLLALLDLRPLGAEGSAERFEGTSPPAGPQRVFGGQVAAQALVAAGRTVDPGRRVHSLHAYFVRPGDPAEPLVYEVDRVRDGRSFSVRRAVAFQHTKPIFFMSASFQRAEEGLTDQSRVMPEVPDPESLPSAAQLLEDHPELVAAARSRPLPVDLRYVYGPGVTPVIEGQPHQLVWMRIDGRLPDDPVVHTCALTFCSDLTLLGSVLSTRGQVWGPGGLVGASLDHAMWFHRPFRADEWFLYDCASPSATGARGLATGSMFTVDGRLIATTVQEGLLRRVGG